MKAFAITSVRQTFLLSRILMALILVFLAVEGAALWQVCREGAQEVRTLRTEGLSSLRNLAALQENLALFQLRSYELMFVAESARPAKLAEAKTLQTQNQALLEELRKTFSSGEGFSEITNLDARLKDYVQAIERARESLDKDFQVSMQILDKEVPDKVRSLDAAARDLKAQCEAFASARADLAVNAFSRIRQTSTILGSAGVLIGLLATVLVTVNSLRIRRSLAMIAGRLSDTSSRVRSSSAHLASASQDLAGATSTSSAFWNGKDTTSPLRSRRWIQSTSRRQPPSSAS